MSSFGLEESKQQTSSDEISQEEIKKYIKQLSMLLDCCYGYPFGLTEIFDFLYLGGEDEARDKDLLKLKGITHVINCASGYIQTGPQYYDSNIKKYIEFDAEDMDNYDIMQHFMESFELIEEARLSGGKVLIHCIMGINRSGALAVAYTMVHKGWGPITAARFVKDVRKRILSNQFFRFLIVNFAKERNLLEYDRPLVSL